MSEAEVKTHYNCLRCYDTKVIIVPTGCFSSGLRPCPECCPDEARYEEMRDMRSPGLWSL